MLRKLNPRRLSRREFLQMSALAGAGLIAAQCAPQAAPEASKT